MSVQPWRPLRFPLGGACPYVFSPFETCLFLISPCCLLNTLAFWFTGSGFSKISSSVKSVEVCLFRWCSSYLECIWSFLKSPCCSVNYVGLPSGFCCFFPLFTNVLRIPDSAGLLSVLPGTESLWESFAGFFLAPGGGGERAFPPQPTVTNRKKGSFFPWERPPWGGPCHRFGVLGIHVVN